MTLPRGSELERGLRHGPWQRHARRGPLPGLIWIAAFAFGAAGGGLYTLAIIDLGRRVRGAALTRMTARIVTAYTAGAVVGPLLSGVALDAAGGVGLAGVATILCLIALPTLFRLPKEIQS